MTFDEFQTRAQAMWDEIPAEFREGVSYLRVERKAVPHPELEGIWTLGECATGELDPGAGERDWRSGVHLYHGSFVRLAAEEADFDWEGELWETLTHEIRHHRESVAGEDDLDAFDYAADENFKRRDGLPFDPLFYRQGEPAGEHAWEVDGDLFVERALDAAQFAVHRDLALTLPRRAGELTVPLPDEQGDIHYVYLDGLTDDDADTVLVLVRRTGAWESVRALFRRAAPVLLESSVSFGDDDGEEAGGDGEADAR